MILGKGSKGRREQGGRELKPGFWGEKSQKVKSPLGDLGAEKGEKGRKAEGRKAVRV